MWQENMRKAHEGTIGRHEFRRLNSSWDNKCAADEPVDGAFRASVDENVIEEASKQTAEEGCDHGTDETVSCLPYGL